MAEEEDEIENLETQIFEIFKKKAQNKQMTVSEYELILEKYQKLLDLKITENEELMQLRFDAKINALVDDEMKKQTELREQFESLKKQYGT
jgi:hypothetical protein